MVERPVGGYCLNLGVTMLGDFLDLASMTSWLELLILIVELTMERSFSTGQVPPLPAFLH